MYFELYTNNTSNRKVLKQNDKKSTNRIPHTKHTPRLGTVRIFPPDKAKIRRKPRQFSIFSQINRSLCILERAILYARGDLSAGKCNNLNKSAGRATHVCDIPTRSTRKCANIMRSWVCIRKFAFAIGVFDYIRLGVSVANLHTQKIALNFVGGATREFFDDFPAFSRVVCFFIKF